MPEPTLTRSTPTDDARRRALRYALRVSNVPDATADTVVNQHLVGEFYGYVHFLVTEKWKDGGVGGKPVTERITTSVFCLGEWDSRPGGIDEMYLTFPPNHSMFLPELLRAQSHPHLQIGMVLGFGNPGYGTSNPELLQLTVRTDYDRRLVTSPNFDKRVIISKAEYLAGG